MITIIKMKRLERRYFTKVLTLLAFSLTSVLLSAQDVIYIDPSNSTSKKEGTIENPFTSLNDFSFENNKVYRIKRGSSITLDNTLFFNADNMTFEAYGTGKHPYIKNIATPSRGVVIGGENVILKGIHFHSPDSLSGAAVAFIRSKNGTIVDCKVQGGTRGLTIGGTEGKVIVKNCEVWGTRDDGMYHRSNDTIIIEDTHIHDVNLDYHSIPTEAYAGGDCIQFDIIDHFEIRNCLLDHTSSGLKFCLIMHDYKSGILEDCTLKTGYNSQHVVYIHPGANLVFRRNVFEGGFYGVWNHSENLKVYNNVFRNQKSAAYRGDGQSASVFNNTMINNEIGILAYAESTKIRNNIICDFTKQSITNGKGIDADYNCFYPKEGTLKGGSHSFVADPLFVDKEKGNFKLDSLSPCIDKGVDVKELYTTSSGKGENVTGKGIDIGAYEYFFKEENDDDTVVVVDTVVKENKKPVASVSFDSQIKGGKVYTLDATKSYDPEGKSLTYHWEEITNYNVPLSDNSSSKISFLTPAVSNQTTVKFSLTVSDGKLSEEKTFDVVVSPQVGNIEELQIKSIQASTYELPNYPENVLDKNVGTRWSAEGDGQWLIFDLGTPHEVYSIKTRFYGNVDRVNYLDYYASNDGETWEPVLLSLESCGFSSKAHLFNVPETKSSLKYRYVKLVGYGNSENGWNSYTEITIMGKTDKQTLANKDYKLEDIVEVYPNPVIDKVKIKLPSSELKFVDLVNAEGRVVQTYKGLNDFNEIPLDHLPAGVYYLNAVFKDNKMVSKSIVIR